MTLKQSVLLASVLLLSATVALSSGFPFVTTDFPPSPRPKSTTEAQDHPYVGMWATEDNHARYQLLPNGRYDAARGTREGAYKGRYRVTGNIIQYWDDTGFYADGEFRDGALFQAGMVLYRKK